MKPPTTLTDDGKRLRDEYNMHRSASPYDSIGKWIAVRLEDGGTDHQLYDTKQQAVRHTNGNERRYCFVQITPMSMTGHYAQTFLNVQRRMAEAGIQMADPDDPNGGRDVIKRSTTQDQNSQFGSMLGYGQPSNITHGMDQY